MTLSRRQPFVTAVRLDRSKVPRFDVYPFNLPVVSHLSHWQVHPSVTFLVGENGSGKSTLLEAIAVNLGLNPEGGSRNFQFATRPSHSSLSEAMVVERTFRKASDLWFLRAESFFNVGTEIERLDEGEGGRRIIDSYGGVSLHEQSHGESFFALFCHRFHGNGLYLLDEPEAALSPARQLAFLSRLHELVQAGAQFIIAAHSPIMMAYPDAHIYTLTPAGLKLTPFEESEHVRITRDFLNNPERSLKVLLDE